MKKILLLASAIFATFTLFAQTAVNFSCNDCTGVNHTLFNELDAGKVIVIDWVMPCSACVGPTLTTKNVVQSFQSSHPGKVFLYIADDYANTNCTSLTSWVNSIGVTGATIFSDGKIKMTDYGSVGMPKVVVIGGPNHQVFYNTNNSVDPTLLQAAITEAIAASSVGIDESVISEKMSLFPNPADETSSLTLELQNQADVQMDILTIDGSKVSQIDKSSLTAGRHTLTVNTSNLSPGIYFVRIQVNGLSGMVKLSVAR